MSGLSPASGNPTARRYLLRQGEIRCSTSRSFSASCCSACISPTNASPIDCKAVRWARQALGSYMDSLCAGRVSRVEFLWHYDPRSRCHERALSFFPAHRASLAADSCAPPGRACRRARFAGWPIVERGAARNQRHLGRPSCRGVGHHHGAAGLRYRLAQVSPKRRQAAFSSTHASLAPDPVANNRSSQCSTSS